MQTAETTEPLLSTPDIRRSSGNRDAMLDASRLIAAVVLLMMHTLESAHLYWQGEFGRFVNPFFTVAAVYLLTVSMRKNWNRPFLSYARIRFLRIYVPFLGWAALSWMAMLLKHRLVSKSPLAPLAISDLLNGRSFQLWFLPFILFVSLVMFWPCRWVGPATSNVRTAIGIASLVVGLIFPFISLPFDEEISRTNYGFFASTAWVSVSPVFLGFAMGLLLTGPARPSPGVAIFGLAFTVAAMVFEVARGRFILLESLAGAAFMFFALAGFSNAAITVLARFPFLIYGIYLSQGVVLETVQTAFSRAHFVASIPLETGVFVITLAICVAVCFALQSSRITRWLLG